MQHGLENIGHIENEVARSLVENGPSMLSSEAIEYGKPDAHKWHNEPVGSLPSVAMCHQEIDTAIVTGEILQILEIANGYTRSWYFSSTGE